MKMLERTDEYPYVKAAEEAKPAWWNKMKKHGVALFDFEDDELMFFDTEMDFLAHVCCRYGSWGYDNEYVATFTLGEKNQIDAHSYFNTPILDRTMRELAVLDGEVNGYPSDFSDAIIYKALEIEKRSEQVKYMNDWIDGIENGNFLVQILANRYKLPFRICPDCRVERTNKEVEA